MPPKKQPQQQGPNKKTVEKKKDKVIEDKTFGLKNKKGKKQQYFIKQVTNQVKFGGSSQQKREANEFESKKAERLKAKEELDSIIRPVQQKVSEGADPKSVLCLFFKQGLCTKGEKCKFSHDLSLEGKAEKKSMYVDSRDIELEQDTIDKWDEDKLKQVVEKKDAAKIKLKTDIVCKHFLLAIEKGVYGWFWECPSKDKCIYRHALPPGFVFKKALKEQEEMQAQDTITLEELIEKERDQLTTSGKTLTKVTLESFLAWKKSKVEEKKQISSKEEAKRKEAFKAGRSHGISGREMFAFNPNLIQDDDDDEEGGGVVTVTYQDSDDEDDHAIDLTDLEAISRQPVTIPLAKVQSKGEASSESGGKPSEHPVDPSLPNQNSQCTSGVASSTNDDPPSKVSASDYQEIPVDESLFAGDDMIEGDSGDEGVAVDESLFDIDTLQDLDLDDPSILESPSS